MRGCLTLSMFSTHTAAKSGGADSDEHLINRIAAGDRLAMDALYRRHHVRVYRFVLRHMNNVAIAEEITGDVFIEIWKQAHRFERRSQAATWMLAIARHKAMSTLRRRAEAPLDDNTATQIPDDAADVEATLQQLQHATVLQHCLTQLSPAHREIIDLVYYHGRSIAEVAEITDAPPNTVKTRMFYARQRLAALLAAHGIEAAA